MEIAIGMKITVTLNIETDLDVMNRTHVIISITDIVPDMDKPAFEENTPVVKL